MFTLSSEPKEYTIKDVARVLRLTPQAITYSIRTSGEIAGIKVSIKTKRGSCIRIPAHVMQKIRMKAAH